MPEHNSEDDEPGHSPDDVEDVESFPPAVSAYQFGAAPSDHAQYEEDDDEGKHNIGVGFIPLLERDMDVGAWGWPHLDTAVVMVSIVETSDEEGEEGNEEAEGVPEQEGVPGPIVGPDASVDCAGGQHLNNYLLIDDMKPLL